MNSLPLFISRRSAAASRPRSPAPSPPPTVLLVLVLVLFVIARLLARQRTGEPRPSAPGWIRRLDPVPAGGTVTTRQAVVAIAVAARRRVALLGRRGRRCAGLAAGRRRRPRGGVRADRGHRLDLVAS